MSFGPIGGARRKPPRHSYERRRLLRLIKDILAAAKIDSGKKRLFEEAVALAEQVTSALAS